MFKTTIVLEVLSEESIVDAELVDIVRECNEGSFSGDIKAQWEEKVSNDHMAHLLEAQRSSPEFLLGEDWEIKKELAKLEFALETTGGRSIELAERIDELRAELRDDGTFDDVKMGLFESDEDDEGEDE